jgi:hypothetical protein
MTPAVFHISGVWITASSLSNGDHGTPLPLGCLEADAGICDFPRVVCDFGGALSWSQGPLQKAHGRIAVARNLMALAAAQLHKSAPQARHLAGRCPSLAGSPVACHPLPLEVTELKGGSSHLLNGDSSMHICTPVTLSSLHFAALLGSA